MATAVEGTPTSIARMSRCAGVAGRAAWSLPILLGLATPSISSGHHAIPVGPPGAVRSVSAPDRPPIAPVCPVVDTLYGVPVTDPYRCMENLRDTVVERWFREENAYTRAVLNRVPGRAALLADIRKYDDAEPATVMDVARLAGDLYFYEKSLPGQQVARLYLRRGVGGPDRVIFDPTAYETAGGPQWTISYYSPSFDGRYVAVVVAPGGTMNTVLHVVDTRTGTDDGEGMEVGPFAGVYWRPDDRSFFYQRMPSADPGAPTSGTGTGSIEVYLHVVGTAASGDRAVLDPGALPGVHVDPAADVPYVITTPGSAWALGLLQHGTRREFALFLAPLDSVGRPGTAWRRIVNADDGVTNVAVHGDDLYLLSHCDAARFQVLRTNLQHPDVAHAEVVFPPGRTVLERIVAAGDALYVEGHDGVVGQLWRIPYGGRAEAVPLPFAGTVAIESAYLSQSLSREGPEQPDLYPEEDGVLLRLESWTRAPTILAYNPSTGQVTNTGLQPAGPFDSGQGLVSEEVTVPSYDGTRVPLSIVHRRTMKQDGRTPVELGAYGAYGWNNAPSYDPEFRAWFDQGGAFAVCHVRGGGVYGESWYRAGWKLTKPNSWRDLVACTEYLIARHYTSAARIALFGASAGGITVGRAMTERPDLFAAVLDIVGVSDPLRIEFTPNGPANVPEFGSVRTQAGFEDLYAMDAYQHVRDWVRYPAVILTTGWNDPDVAPWQAGKMAARLQAATASGRPVLLRVDYSAGHGSWGATRAQTQAWRADTWSFALWQLGVPGFQPAKTEQPTASRR